MTQATGNDDIYKFKITMIYPKGIWRNLDIQGSTNLTRFAEAITDSFDFDLDHSFGFYNNLKSIYDSTEGYSSYCETGLPLIPGEKSVNKYCIHQVFQPQKKMLFLFDYGDEWRFVVKCLGTGKPNPQMIYPKVMSEKGIPPSQYSQNSESETSSDYDNLDLEEYI